ncbi:MAG: tetratricopeptide repeat protein [Dehalococcoidia bacterium]|jgi:tetratricopeptide (TPR) repeat protein
MMKWFRAHLEGTLWLVWLGGGALLAGLVAAVLKLETAGGTLSFTGWWLIIILSAGYLATLIKVCNWVLEEKAQDRSIMWAFLIGIVGGIVPIVVALFGRNNTIIKSAGKVDSVNDFEIRRLVDREKDQPLNIGRISDRGLRLAREHFSRAQEHEGRGERDKAIAEYNKALEFDSGYAMAYYNRGLLLARTGKKTRARADFQKVISLSGGAGLSDMARQALEELDVYNVGNQ